ncbi:hypothetical protein BDY21DRAFT_362162 [Lineolata rhizophorae]|uniref:Uncharacterized protein n=1 Tax=Lineolata rhizophorae TaxID=578093 RepID=A0A6A6P6F1_9PEZI|nr:hypothetical protein BDY21DRAFT_362162 [Lineolata rhizophorae]
MWCPLLGGPCSAHPLLAAPAQQQRRRKGAAIDPGPPRTAAAAFGRAPWALPWPPAKPAEHKPAPTSPPALPAHKQPRSLPGACLSSTACDPWRRPAAKPLRARVLFWDGGPFSSDE